MNSVTIQTPATPKDVKAYKKAMQHSETTRNALKRLALALGYTAEEISQMGNNMAECMEQIAMLQKQAALMAEEIKRGVKQLSSDVAEELAQLKREQREFGRSRLAQFAKTFPNRKRYAKPRPYWFRTRSFCVRSPYG